MTTDEKFISIRWGVEDVQEVRKDLSENQAFMVLKMAEREHDANIGINWDVLKTWADFLFPTKRGKKK